MKPFVFGIIAAIAIALGGCQIGGTTVNIDANDVINSTKTACAFVPTVATVEAELKANPTITSATAIASLICNAVNNAPPLPGAHVGDATADHLVAVVKGPDGKDISIIGHFSK